MSDALDKIEKEKGWDIPIHVDGASGGFFAPFVHPKLEWDFRLPRVKSIQSSGHKFGLACTSSEPHLRLTLADVGVGWVVWRDHKVRMQRGAHADGAVPAQGAHLRASRA